jgi:hypothetical protein
LPKLKIAPIIGKAVWDQRGDIRDVISIGKLVRKNDGPEEAEQIIRTETRIWLKITSSNARINSSIDQILRVACIPSILLMQFQQLQLQQLAAASIPSEG